MKIERYDDPLISFKSNGLKPDMFFYDTRDKEFRVWVLDNVIFAAKI